MKETTRVNKLLELLTEEEKNQFIAAVEDDFGCQWDGKWKVKGVFTDLFKVLRLE